MISPRSTIRVPEIGAERDRVEVGAWLVEVGQNFIEGDRLVELVLPGVVFHVAAEESGRIVEMKRHSGTPVAEGELLAIIASEEQSA